MVVSAAIAGCGAANHTAAPSSSSASPSATSTATPPAISAAAVAALDAYTGMWQAEEVAGRTDNYQSPLLPAHASGAALSLLVRGLYGYQLQHLVIKGQLVLHPRVTSLTPSDEPTAAQILDCADDTHWLVYKTTGGLQNNVPGGHRRVTAVVQDVDGIWKVTTLDSGAEGTC